MLVSLRFVAVTGGQRAKSAVVAVAAASSGRVAKVKSSCRSFSFLPFAQGTFLIPLLPALYRKVPAAVRSRSRQCHRPRSDAVSLRRRLRAGCGSSVSGRRWEVVLFCRGRAVARRVTAESCHPFGGPSRRAPPLPERWVPPTVLAEPLALLRAPG